MTTFERIRELAKKQGKSLNKVEEELGYGRNVLYRLKNTDPSSERLKEIADYFQVSTDYLLGRTDNPSVPSEDSNKSMAKQVMMRMNTTGISQEDLEDIEQEMETFFKWRLEQIRQEREQGGK